MIQVTAIAIGVVMLVAEPTAIDRSPGLPSLYGTIESTTAQGMLVRQDEGGDPKLVPWYQLRGGELPEGIDRKHAKPAMDAWRAHTRLARGDVSSAMPIYAQLSRTYMWESGPQSLDVCDGLARCLISTGKRTEAVEPMLAVFVASGFDPTLSITGVDEALRVRLDLPPVFSGDDLGSELEPVGVQVDSRTRLLHAYFAMAVCDRETRAARVARIEELKRASRTRDAGLVLIEQMVYAQSHPDESKRRGARDSLNRRTQTQRGTWIEVWARLALGAGQIRDDDPYTRDQGVIELVHVIVRLGDVDPGLTLLAAKIAEDYLRETDRAQWGAQLMQDARQNTNSHHP